MTGLAHASSPVPAATPWVLMGREGDCVEIEGAQRRRFDDLPPVRSPQEMAAALGAAGVVFTLRALPQVGANAWLVEVPARELSLLFVDRSMCRSVSRGPGR